jgi:hypothetical protein
MSCSAEHYIQAIQFFAEFVTPASDVHECLAQFPDR